LYAKHYSKDPVKQAKVSCFLGGVMLQDQFPDLAKTALNQLRQFALSQPHGQRFLQELLQHPSPPDTSKDAMPLSTAKQAMIFENIGILYLERKKLEKARLNFTKAIEHSTPEEKTKLTAFLKRINLE
jgi:ABC-type bacteriocin/lantibiotic exporter with double-glycine peptidase domain